MSLLTPVDREFAVLPAGYIRDKVVLATFRSGLRRRLNPQTGVIFTEDEINRATRPGSRWYQEAQAIDDYGQLRQRNAIWLADQIRLDRASSRWLRDYHGRPRIGDPLAPTGSSGVVRATGTPGVLVQGSTLPGAQGAYTARDPAGNVYQVFITSEIEEDGRVDVTMSALSAGAATNIDVGTVLTWVTRDPSMAPTCVVVDERFRGGTDQETDSEYQLRIADSIRHKAGAGNDAQFRDWGRASSNAIEDAFIYPCFLRAGSVQVALTAKRAGTVGPLGRFPGSSTLAAATSYLVPPLSPVVPPRAFVLVTSQQPEPSDLTLQLGLQRGTDAGWADSTPFPSWHATTPAITEIVSATVFKITCPANETLPNQSALATLTGQNAPRMMLWNEAASRFIEPPVAQVEDEGSNVFEVTLTNEMVDFVPAVGMVVSPFMGRNEVVAESTEDYFDELGPGQLFNLASDSRGSRCHRFPDVTDRYPSRAGALVATRVIEALGGSGSDAVLSSITNTAPSYPTNLLNGPNRLTLGKLGIYELT